MSAPVRLASLSAARSSSTTSAPVRFAKLAPVRPPPGTPSSKISAPVRSVIFAPVSELSCTSKPVSASSLTSAPVSESSWTWVPVTAPSRMSEDSMQPAHISSPPAAMVTPPVWFTATLRTVVTSLSSAIEVRVGSRRPRTATASLSSRSTASVPLTAKSAPAGPWMTKGVCNVHVPPSGSSESPTEFGARLSAVRLSSRTSASVIALNASSRWPTESSARLRAVRLSRRILLLSMMLSCSSAVRTDPVARLRAVRLLSRMSASVRESFWISSLRTSRSAIVPLSRHSGQMRSTVSVVPLTSSSYGDSSEGSPGVATPILPPGTTQSVPCVWSWLTTLRSAGSMKNPGPSRSRSTRTLTSL